MDKIEINRYCYSNIPVLSTSIKNDIAEITEYMGYNEGELYCIALKNSEGQLIRGLRSLIKDTVICICEDDEYHLTDSDVELYLNHYPKRADIMIPYSLGHHSCISRQYIEGCYNKKSIVDDSTDDSILFLDGKKIEFVDDSVFTYAESNRYVDPTKVFSASFIQSYKNELRNLWKPGVYGILEEIFTLQAYCYTTLNIDQLNSREATKIFIYRRGVTNYIALAAFLKTADISYNEFKYSIYKDGYEDISDIIINGAHAKRIKAFGKIFDLKVNLYSKYEIKEDVPVTNPARNSVEGYVYVLINPTMEGFVKIGKTTHHPRERAKELSTATGVASPFIVAYFRQFHNCHNAEKLVHKELETRGVRYNSSREFFRIETHEAVEVISKLRNDDRNDPKDKFSTSSIGYDYLPNICIDSSLEAKALFKEAYRYKSVDDIDTTLAYFKAASLKGLVYADRAIGDELSSQSPEALINIIHDAYIKGVKKGDIACYYKLAHVYDQYLNDFVKADIYWSLYFDNINTAIKIYEIDRYAFMNVLGNPFSAIGDYLDRCIGNFSRNPRSVMEKYIPMFKKYRCEMLNRGGISQKTVDFLNSL